MVHPIVINELIVLLANSFIGEVDTDDMDVIGNFFAALGAMMIFNSCGNGKATAEVDAEVQTEDTVVITGENDGRYVYCDE